MSVVSTLTKTQGGVLLAHTQQATAVVTVGAAVDVSTKFAARVFVKMGRTVVTALGNEIKYRLEGSAKSSGNDEWFPLLQWSSYTGKTTCNAPTLNGATTAGNTTAILSSGTGFVAGSAVYCRETGTPGNSEWSRMSAVSGTTITFEEAQTRNHTNGITITNLAEAYTWDVDCVALGRIRLVVDSASAASGQTVDVIGWVVTFDSALST